jgi:hypothetical protein
MTNYRSSSIHRGISTRALKILELAVVLSEEQEYQKTTSLHVLQAMLLIARAPIRDCLRRNGVTSEALDLYLAHHRSRIEAILANEHDLYPQWDSLVTYSFGANASDRYSMATIIDDVDLLYGFALVSRWAGLSEFIREAHGQPHGFSTRVIRDCKRISKDGRIEAEVDPSSRINVLLSDSRDRSALLASRNTPNSYPFVPPIWATCLVLLHYRKHMKWSWATLLGLLIALVVGKYAPPLIFFVRTSTHKSGAILRYPPGWGDGRDPAEAKQ